MEGSTHIKIERKIDLLKPGTLIFPANFRGMGSDVAIKNALSRLAKTNRFESDYAVMREQMIYGESLPFGKLIQKLRELRWRFRDKRPVPLPPGMSLKNVIEDAKQYAMAQGLLGNPVEGTFISTPVHLI